MKLNLVSHTEGGVEYLELCSNTQVSTNAVDLIKFLRSVPRTCAVFVLMVPLKAVLHYSSEVLR